MTAKEIRRMVELLDKFTKQPVNTEHYGLLLAFLIQRLIR